MISYTPDSFKEYMSFRKQDRIGIRRSVDTSQPLEEEEVVRRDLDFSQSVDVTRPRAASNSSTTSSFLTSVQVVPTSGGKYQVYPGTHDNQPHGYHGDSKKAMTKSLLISRNYGHNISNPDFSRQRLENDLDLRREQVKSWKRFKPSNHDNRSRLHSASPDFPCSCEKYHSHTFKQGPKIALPLTMVPELSELRQLPEVVAANQNHLTVCNTFWKVYLVCSEYKHGDKTVDFKSLWPGDNTIKDFLNDGVQDTGLRSAIWELCLLSVCSGPLSVLKALLDLSLIRIDYQFEGDVGLLHLACLLDNMEAVQLLTQYGISPKIKDKHGRIAGQMCHCPRSRKQIPAKYLGSVERHKTLLVKPGLQDKDTIFKLASNPKHFYETQNKLQTLDFKVDKEMNSDGDYLIHVACRAGLCQLPLLMSLVRLQNCDVELHNLDGMTPLMIIAREGESNLCDIFMCLFGANPNKRNGENGKTALHYAVIGNSVSTVNCLLKRGADVNMEDNDGCLPDDMPLSTSSAEDCREAIQVHRAHRCQYLAEMIKEDSVYPIDIRSTDLTQVDADGYTLIMLAAQNDRVNNLESLTAVGTNTINAQHGKTGMTALALAAAAGNALSVRTLLRTGANPTIRDLSGYLPLHHAVLNNHSQAVDVFLEFFPLAYVGLYKALKICKKSVIHDKICSAWERRQHEIVAPELRMCAMGGKAEELFCLLEEGDNINYKSDLSNLPPLSLAVENSHIEVVKLLKEKGADIRRRDPQTGSSVLHIVAKTGHQEMAKYLMEFCQPSHDMPTAKKGPCLDINAMNNDKKTALQIAADQGFIKLVNLLISKGATTALLNSQGTLFTSSDFEGVRVLIESHRQEHTKDVMKYVADKSRRSLMKLSKIWVPRFDHNLRDKNGDTPLMVACKKGHVEVIKVLIESAVYAAQCSWDEGSDGHSDADSGVPDLPPWKSRTGSIAAFSDAEDMTKSMDKSQDFTETLPLNMNNDFGRSLNPGDLQNSLIYERHAMGKESQQLNTLLQDVERPKGLYIYHDGIVSHICAVNLFDGRTPLHRAIEGGDNPVITSMLVATDSAVINMQDAGGLTPVHLACKMGRKKILEQLLAVEGVDISLFTLNGHLPEEMTSNKSLIKLIQKARRGQPVRPRQTAEQLEATPSITSLTDSAHTSPSTAKASTIDLEKVYNRYQRLKDRDNKQHYV